MTMIKKAAALFLSLCFLAAAASVLPGAAYGEEAESLCFRHMCRAKTGQDGLQIYKNADSKSAVVTRTDPGEACLILGEVKNFYLVSCHDRTGYVSKKKAEVFSEKTPEPLPEKLCDTVSPVKAVPSRLDSRLELQGTVTSDRPLDALQFFIWDERQFQVEYVHLLPLKKPSASVDMSLYPKILPLKEMAGGRKTLVIEGVSGNELSVLYRCPVYVRGKSKELPNVNQWCEGLPKAVRDTDIKTSWSPDEKTPSLTFTVAAEAQAVLMMLEWKVLPDDCTVETLDADGMLLSRTELNQRFYADCVDLDADVRTITVTPRGEKAALSSVRLYAEPYSRHVIQKWEPAPEKLDLLVISTHQDDEFLFFGGTIPYYAAREDVSMAVMYMVNCGRMRYAEALDSLWTAGLKKHPFFLNLPDSYTHSLGEAKGLWSSRRPMEQLIRVLRQYRPEVIVVHDFRGEYGNGLHKLTAALTAEAVTLAADEAQDPESAALYGTWQVKKLYVHLYEENQIRMDWDQPLDEDGFITPMFLAREAFDRHRSQTALYSMDYDGHRYDNTLFGLYYSAVGEDKLKNDFLENIR